MDAVSSERVSLQLQPFKRGEGMTTASRSRRMAAIGQRRTAPEEWVAAWLRARGIAYRRNVRTLPGRPDFANRRASFAIFVHGCFWHRHPGCARTTTPSRNKPFWEAKFAANVARDEARIRELEAGAFEVIVVWECEAGDHERLDARLSRLVARVL